VAGAVILEHLPVGITVERIGEVEVVDDRLALLDWKAENDEQPDPGGVEIPVRLFQVIQTW